MKIDLNRMDLTNLETLAKIGLPALKKSASPDDKTTARRIAKTMNRIKREAAKLDNRLVKT